MYCVVFVLLSPATFGPCLFAAAENDVIDVVFTTPPSYHLRLDAMDRAEFNLILPSAMRADVKGNTTTTAVRCCVIHVLDIGKYTVTWVTLACYTPSSDRFESMECTTFRRGVPRFIRLI